MPEAAVHEYHCLEFRKDNIRPSLDGPAVEPVSQPARMEGTAKHELRLRVLAPDACHHSRSRLLVNEVCHGL